MTTPSAPRNRPLAEFVLVTVTLFWGGTFPVVKEAITEVPVLCFLWIRFALSAGLLAVLAGRGLATLDRRGIRRGVLLGSLLFLSYLFQTLGLERTSASNAGFLTGLNVVWVPLLVGPLLNKPPSTGAKVGVAFAVGGLLLLTGHVPWRMGAGDALVVLCSVFVALHILGLDALTEGYDGRALAFVQIATMAVLSLAGNLAFEPVTWPSHWSSSLTGALLVTAVFATAYAFWAMTTFQRWTTPTRAALIYTLEPVFAALFSVLLAGEVLTPAAWAGGALIVLGMATAEAWPSRAPPKRKSETPGEPVG